MKLAAFLALAALGIYRLPALRRGGAGTMSELALLAGAGALFMGGSAVPLETVDSWFGGTNVVNLLQNVLATLAIWFMTMTARIMATGEWPSRRAVYELGLVLIAFIIPFALMDRGPTSGTFIRSTAQNGWLWLYASIYMTYVAYLMGWMILALGKRRARPYVVVRVGAFLMGTASVVEVVYLTARVLGARPEWLGDLFVPLFYGGILLIAGGLAWFPAARQVRVLSLRIAAALLRRAAAAHPGAASESTPAWRATAHDTYRLAVQIADLGNAVELTRSERLVLRFATFLLNLQVPAPRIMTMSASPKAAG